MPIYVYETTGKTKRRFEVKQSMNDAALKNDPETGEPVQRVIMGGYGFLEKGKAKSGGSSAPTPSRSGGGSCGSGCGCH